MLKRLTGTELISLLSSLFGFIGFSASTIVNSSKTLEVALSLLFCVGFTAWFTSVFLNYLRRVNFPNKTTLIESTFTFKCDDKGGGFNNTHPTTGTPSAYLERKTHFLPRQKNQKKFDRMHYIADYSPLNANEILDVYEHDAIIECFPHINDDHNKSIETPSIRTRVSNFRKLVIDAVPRHSETFNSFKRFIITEKIRLPNDFDMLSEFYSIENPEPVDKRNIKFVFEGIPLESFRVQLKFGIRRDKFVTIKPSEESSPNRAVYLYSIKSPEVGTNIEFSWTYKDPKWPVRETLPENEEI